MRRGIDYDDNNLNMTYQVNQPQNFLYNIKAGIAFNRIGGTSNQNVSSAGQSFLATNLLRTDYTKYIIGNYFEKNLGERGGTLLANINCQRFSTFYNSAYNELIESDLAVNNSNSKYKTHLDAIFSEVHIAQLSETDQWIDTELVYHGNSTLKPYKTHSAGIRFVWNYKYLDCAVRGNFVSSPDMICDMYKVTDNYMLQTLVNLSKYQIWSTQIDFSLKPLGNRKLMFWNRIILADLKGRNQEYSWKEYRFQWMTELALNLEHWTAALFYQYPVRIVEGQLERPRAECWSAMLLYRPITNLTLGLEWYMPFGKGFKDSEHTVNSAPVADTEYKIMDLNNLLSIKLSYNFSYGCNRNYASPQYDNYDNDSGILHK